MELTSEEIVALSNALNEVLHGPDAIEDWEFATRMGVSRQEALRLLRRLVDLADRPG
jgi:hypothetical protein